jgi:hypothetical protein
MYDWDMNEQLVIERIDELEIRINKRFDGLHQAFRQWAAPLETRGHLQAAQIGALEAEITALKQRVHLLEGSTS